MAVGFRIGNVKKVSAVEPIESMERLPGERQALFTKTWRVEPHRAEGALLITRTDEPPLAPKTVDIPRLERESVARLQRLGIPSTEIGAVATRRLFSADNDGRAVDAPTLQRYKTFVRRELNGIPVEGHRAVVTHGPGGDFVRANMLWPAIAREGHVATTRMRTPEIVRLAESALRKEGEETGAVKLNWKYVPVKRANGEVVLHLAVAAHIQPKSEKGTEPREVTVLLSND